MSYIQVGGFLLDTAQFSFAEFLGGHGAHDFAGDAILGLGKMDAPIDHERPPEPRLQNVNACFIWIVEAVKRKPVSQFPGIVVVADARAELTGLYIALTITGTKEYIVPPTQFQHPLGDGKVLSFDAVILKPRLMRVPLEMRTNLILDIRQEV